jgi:hypothetical protein
MDATSPATPSASVPVPGAVDLYWIPLGAGGHSVRHNGRFYEAVTAAVQGRARCELYHAALEVTVGEGRYVIEMTPIPDRRGAQRGVVVEGPVGSAWLARLRLFRYEIRCWCNGSIPDAHYATQPPLRVGTDVTQARRLLDLVAQVPPLVWGRDQDHLGEMWNSNSVTAWLLARAGVDIDTVTPPAGGRAPGWHAGVRLAHPPAVTSSFAPTRADRRLRLRHRPGEADERIATRPDPPSAPPRPPGHDGSGQRARQVTSQMSDVIADLPRLLTAPLYRRWHLRWGSTTAEITAPMPGDDLVARPPFCATRAITIDAPPHAVWPWLAQVGYGRAGFYSNDLLDNLAQPSATTILAQHQHLELGQWVSMSPTPSERTAFKVHGFKTPQWLLWAKPDSTWSWTLTPLNHDRTRLVTRIRATYDWTHPLGAAVGMVLLEFGDFAMIRRMLRGIKTRAEATHAATAPAEPRLHPDDERTASLAASTASHGQPSSRR